MAGLEGDLGFTVELNCSLCAEFQGQPDNLYRELCPNGPSSRIVDESEHLVAMPSLGQITEGYMLVCTRAHVRRMAHLTKEELREVEEFSRGVEAVLRTIYAKPMVAFEHGCGAAPYTAGACTDHAHLHLVPTDADMLPLLQKFFAWEEVPSLAKLVDRLSDDQAYLYYMNGKSQRFVTVVSEILPSQFMRQILASTLGRPDLWDWRVHVGEDRVISAHRKYMVTSSRMNVLAPQSDAST